MADSKEKLFFTYFRSKQLFISVILLRKEVGNYEVCYVDIAK